MHTNMHTQRTLGRGRRAGSMVCSRVHGESLTRNLVAALGTAGRPMQIEQNEWEESDSKQGPKLSVSS